MPRRKIVYLIDRVVDLRPVLLLAERHDLRLVLPRLIHDDLGEQVEMVTAVPLAGRGVGFIRSAVSWLLSESRTCDLIIAQGDGHAATAANLAGRFGRVPSLLLFDRPTIDFARKEGMSDGALAAVKAQSWLNHRLARASLQTDPYTASKAHVANPTLVPLHGVDMQKYSPGSALEARTALDIDHQGPLVLLISGPPNGDPQTFFASIDVVKEEAPSLGLMFFDPKAKQMAEAKGSPAWLIDPARSAEAYRAADVVVHACSTEGLEMKVVEAMACACSVVTSATWSLIELVGYTGAGITAPVGDHLVMADAILWFLEHQEDRAAAYAARARDVAEERFNAGLVGDLWQKAIQEAVGA